MSLLNPALLMGQSLEWLSVLFIVSVKGTVMLATAALLSRILRRASAKVRHVLWLTALSSLLVLPLLSNGLQPLRVPILPPSLFPVEIGASEVQPSSASASHLVRQRATPGREQVPGAGEELPTEGQVTLASDVADHRGQLREPPQSASARQEVLTKWLSWPMAIVLFWLAGVLLAVVRLLIGVIRVRKVVRTATELTGEPWSALSLELSHQLHLTSPMRLLRSEHPIMPMTCGGLSAVVLLPNDADRWPADRRNAVVLHELIHVKRRDVLTNMLAQIVCALHWFNPLAWYALFQLRKEQEWACDEQVLSTGVKASDYAAHLFEIARAFRPVGWSAGTTTGMARYSQLEERLRAILRPHTGRYQNVRAMGLSLAVMCTVLLPLAAARLVRAERGTRARALTSNQDERRGNEAKLEPRVNLPQIGIDVAANESSLDSAPQDRQIAPATQPQQPNLQETKNEMTARGLDDFSVEEQNRLRNNGVGAEYIRELEDAGFHKLTVAQLIALSSNGVHADYVASLGSVGYTGLGPNEIIALKTNGITTDVIRAFQAVRYADFKAKNYIAFRSNGVTPAYLRSMQTNGYNRLTPKQIVDMWVAGVNAEFIKAARSRGYSDLSPEQLIELKQHRSL